MVKKLLIITLGLLLLLAVILATAGWWLVKDEQGVRWLLAEVSRRTAVTAEVRQIEGRLLDHLLLEGITVSWARGEVRLDRFELRWSPVLLLRGHLGIEELSLSGGSVAWKAPATGRTGEAAPPSRFSWPRLAGWPLYLRASLAALQVESLELRPPTGEIRRLDRLKARLDWQEGVFSVAELEASAADYRLQGGASAGFGPPLLRLDLQLTLPTAPAGFESLALQVDLEPGAAAELAGPMIMQGRSGKEMHLQLAADLALRADTIRLRRFELTQAGRHGVLSGEGEARLAGGPPQWRLQAKLADLDLAAETGVTTAISGTIEGAGEGGEYQGSFDLSNRTSGWQAARLSGPFSGNAAGITFPQLSGSFLRGELSGNLHLGWRDGFTLAGALRGRRLDPAGITPDWPGQVNLDLAGDLSIPPSGTLSGQLKGRLLESTLRGLPLTGSVDAEIADRDLRLASFELHGEGFDLSGRGQLSERLDWRAEIVRLSGLVPGAQGSLTARGWLQWRHGKLAGEIEGQGRKMMFGKLQIAELKLAAGLSPGASTFVASASGSEIAYERWQLKSAELDASGSVQKHRIDLQARWIDGELQVTGAGGWGDNLWKGELLQLDGRDARAGLWRLPDPAGIAVAADRFRVSALRLTGMGSEELRLAGELAWKAGRGEAEAHWEDIDLGRLSPWLPEVSLAGRSSGNAKVRWRENRPLELAGSLTGAAELTHPGGLVEMRHVAAEFDWSGAGLQASLAATFEDGGGIDVSFATSEVFQAAFPQRGEALVAWEDLDLHLLDPWLKPVSVSGRSSGDSRLRWQPDGSLLLSGHAEAAGTVIHDEAQVTVRKVETDVAWNADGLRATLAVELQEGGRLTARISSVQPGRLALPEKARVEADWVDLDLSRLRPWFPEGVELTGRLGGEAAGEWQPGGRLAATGSVAIDEGRLRWGTESGEVAADLGTARLKWEWRDASLAGEMKMVLAEYGEAEGNFRLPLPARFPVAVNPAGALQMALTAKVSEKGLLSAVLPGLVHKSQGKLEAKVQVGGTWQAPDFSGSLHLSEAGAYLPVAGIELREVTLDCELAGDELQIASFSARSGPGRVEGSGRVRLSRWRPVAYDGKLKGERFQAVHLPELELLVNPDLTFEGSAKHLQVRGKVLLPELLVLGREQRGVVRESPDVVIVGGPESTERTLPFSLDVEIHVVLGDRVLVKVAGIDARLAGDLDLHITGPETITANGEIRVAQGIYSTYGAQLKIERGRLLFAGGPIDRPTFDILALRTVGEIKAGVQVTGTPRVPVVKLYSEPTMPDTDVLAYIILGHPLGEDAAQAGLLTAAAGALLARGESTVLQDRIKRRLGVDVLTVEGSGDVETSMVTIGKYLSPSLYLSFGQSLFTNAHEAKLRYTISKKWELESKYAGEASGVDLFYKIEFN